MEPDGSIRLVEYTADAKNGFQAVVKKFGHSHHPDTVTHHTNHGHHKHHLHEGSDGGGGGYAPSYYTGGIGGDHHYESPVAAAHVHDEGYREPAAHSNHFEPPALANHFEPPAAFGGDDHYEPVPSPHAFGDFYNRPAGSHHAVHHGTDRYGGNQYGQPPPSAYNHYEPPLGPAHYGQPVVPVEKPIVPGLYEQPVVPAHYEPEVASGPEVDDFEQDSPAPSHFAGGMPTAHGDYGSAPQEQYYSGPLRFPAASRDNDFDWSARADGDHDISPVGYELPAGSDGGGGGARERPEYLRKYFKPDYRDRRVNSFYGDGDE